MFSPNRRPPKKDPARQERTTSRETQNRAIATIVLTAVLLVFWFGSISLAERRGNETLLYGVMIVYFAAFAALLIAYLVYNRGFVNRDVTVDMLPADWTAERKQAFLDDNRRRADRSRWMMVLIIPFVVVFMVEALYLFVWDGFFAGLIGA